MLQPTEPEAQYSPLHRDSGNATVSESRLTNNVAQVVSCHKDFIDTALGGSLGRRVKTLSIMHTINILG